MFRIWLKIDGTLALLLGLALFFLPDFTLSFFIIQKRDGVHYHMARVAGSVLLAQAYTWFYWSKAKDSYLGTAAMVTRVVSAVFTVAAVLHARTFNSELFIDHNMKRLLYAFAISLVTSILMTFGIRFPIGEFIHEKKKMHIFNSLIQIDTLLALIIGGLWCAYPDQIIHRQVQFTLNETHYFVCRFFGAFLLSTGILSNYSLLFHRTEDRTSWGQGRAMICVLIFSSQVFSQFAYPESWHGGHWYGMGIFSIWSIVCWTCSILQYIGRFR